MRSRMSLLLEQYGIDSNDGDGSGSSNHLDPNSLSFDADACFKDIISRKSGDDLLAEDKKLSSEINRLDSQMQALVYDNYNKFIDATETIRIMKDKVESMEDEMNMLEKNIARIIQYSDSVQDSLKGNQVKISELSGVFLLVKKLQFLFELPARLRTCIEMKAYGQAVKYYLGVSDILEQYGSMPAFAQIAKDCREIAADLKVRLRDQLKTTMSAEVARESIDLLLDLGEDSQSLRHDYIATQRPGLLANGRAVIQKTHEARFGELLTYLCSQKYKAVFKTLEDYVKSLPLAAQELELNFVDELKKIVDRESSNLTAREVYSTMVPTTTLEWLTKVLKGKYEAPPSVSLTSLAWIVGEVSGIFPKFHMFLLYYSRLFVQKENMNAQVLKEATADLEAFTNEVFKDLFKFLQRQFSRSSNSANEIIEALISLKGVVDPISGMMPHPVLTEMMEETVSKALHSYSDSSFDNLLNSIKNKLIEVVALTARRSDSWNIREVVDTVLDDIMSKTTDVLSELQPLTTHHPKAPFLEGFRDVITTSIHINIQQVILFIGTVVQERRAVAAPSSLLALAGICYGFIDKLDSLSNQTNSMFKRSDGVQIMNADVMRMDVEENARQTLALFVDVQGAQLSSIARKGLESRTWSLAKAEPKDVSHAIEMIVNDLHDISPFIHDLFPSDKLESPAQEERVKELAARRPGGKTNDKTYDAMFAAPLELFSEVLPTKYSILTGVVKVVLKIIVEVVRTQTFNKFGFHQAQVDFAYLRVALLPYADRLSVVKRLTDLLLSSAESRCVDPVRMPTEAVDAIVKARVGSLFVSPGASTSSAN